MNIQVWYSSVLAAVQFFEFMSCELTERAQWHSSLVGIRVVIAPTGLRDRWIVQILIIEIDWPLMWPFIVLLLDFHKLRNYIMHYKWRSYVVFIIHFASMVPSCFIHSPVSAVYWVIWFYVGFREWIRRAAFPLGLWWGLALLYLI